MYDIIIAEDEEIFRKVLPVIIDWNALGFRIAGVVENGQKALEFLKKCHADVILTDIRMPVLNGLDLAMEVKNRFPATRVILLSAFNEFDYARKGIDCSVYGYILKSESEDEIVKYFKKLKTVLDNEQLFESSDIWVQRELYFQNILKDEAIKSFQIESAAKKAHLPNRYEICTITVFELNEIRYMNYLFGSCHVDELLNRIRDQLVTRIELTHMGYIITSGVSIVAVWTIDRQNILHELDSIFTDLSAELQLYDNGNEPGVSITCAIGGTGSEISGLRQSYQNAVDALCCRTYIGGGRIIDSKSVIKCSHTLPDTDEGKVTGEILTLVREGNSAKVAEYIDGIEKCYKARMIMEMDIAIVFGIKVILAVMGDIGKMRINADDELLLKSSYIIKILSFCDTIPCAFRQLKLFLVETMVFLSSDNITQNSKMIEEAVRYMNLNYSGQIGLEDVARHVNVHPVYLSRLFNRDISKTFKTVLTEIRMGKAKELLMNMDYKIYEISELVGYEKPRYFSELFKSSTGLTPLEYREKYKI